MTLARRALRFEALGEVIQDAEMLLERGYDKAGNWDLAQVCGHLASWFHYQISGFPPPPLLLRPLFWTIRSTIGPRLARKMLAAETMREGMTTIPQSVKKPGIKDAVAVAELRQTILYWSDYAGSLHPSPLFGTLPRESWRKGHLIHCAHHLSFLIPKS